MKEEGKGEEKGGLAPKLGSLAVSAGDTPWTSVHWGLYMQIREERRERTDEKVGIGKEKGIGREGEGDNRKSSDGRIWINSGSLGKIVDPLLATNTIQCSCGVPFVFGASYKRSNLLT